MSFSRHWLRSMRPHLAPNALQLPGLMADPVEAVHAARIAIELQFVLDLLRTDGPITQRAGMAVPGTRPHGLLRLARQRPVHYAASSFATQLLRIEKHALVHADYVASGVPEADSWQRITACRSMTWKSGTATGSAALKDLRTAPKAPEVLQRKGRVAASARRKARHRAAPRRTPCEGLRAQRVRVCAAADFSSTQEQGLLWSGRLPCAFASASDMY